ncbi:MAG: UDP-N-acetylglucosamine--N-acetylmuramyl-(pentapeptide) pyrophosphoryl-undecaprenol N-acetylglucosamine transferase [Planctomycetota bacterium]
MKHVVLAGGGTGGHLVPGINLAEGIQRRWPEARITFFTSGRPVEHKLLEGRFEGRVLPAPKGGATWRRGLSSVRAVPEAFIRAYTHFLKVKPSAFVGLGGYAAVPAALAARSLRVPIYLLEQNVVPGRATRCLSAMATEIHCQWDETLEKLSDRSRTLVSGTPLRADLTQERTEQAYRERGLEPARPTLLVMGGSQGACSVDDAVVRSLEKAKGRRWQAIHLTGAGEEERVRAAYRTAGLPHWVASFASDMPAIYALADLVLARAGGTTCAELAAAGLPAVFVPYPWHKDKHQYRNAQAMAGRCGSVWVEQSSLTPVCFEHLVLGLLDDRSRLEQISARMRRVFRLDATTTICDSLGRIPPRESGATAKWAYRS